MNSNFKTYFQWTFGISFIIFLLILVYIFMSAYLIVYSESSLHTLLKQPFAIKMLHIYYNFLTFIIILSPIFLFYILWFFKSSDDFFIELGINRLFANVLNIGSWCIMPGLSLIFTPLYLYYRFNKVGKI